MDPPIGVPQWGIPMESYLLVYSILQAKNSFYNQFLLNFYDAPPQRRDAYPQSSGHRVVLGEVVST